jgi:nucleoside 2-deoxyribosyltransferase
MKVYLSGPMRGYPDYNFAEFLKAESRWTGAGHQVFSPARTSRALNYKEAESKEDLRHLMMVDIACIYSADAIALLDGWEKSSGVAVELALAHFLDLDIYFATDMTRMEIYPAELNITYNYLVTKYIYGEVDAVTNKTRTCE